VTDSTALPIPSAGPRRRVLLVGWDAADWRMIEPLMRAGRMPNFSKFIAEGVSGNIASLTPMISPILWTSIATGKWGDKHQILGFAEPDGTTGKCRPVTSTSRKCEALWTILHRNGRSASVVNWFASHPAEACDGVIISDRFAPPVGPPNKPWPVPAGTISPAALSDKAAKLRVHPAMTTPDQIRRFVPRLNEIDLRQPAKPAGDTPPATDSTLAAATDPASEERNKINELRALLAQCATVHTAATWILKEHASDFVGVYYDAIDRFAHAFMEFHPPRMPHVPERHFELFKGVMETCYEFHDMMLGRLMQLAGPETTVIVVSDHGFFSDDLRPEGTSAIQGGKPVAWHRPFGVFAARGPEIKQGEKIYGASLLDVAPTVLALMGVPVGRDMDGQVLTQIFRTPASVAFVESHEPPAEQKRETPADEDPWVVQQMLDQLVQLGYLSENSTDEVVVDRMRNLAQIYLATGRPALAKTQFENALEKKPGDESSRLGISRCLLAEGKTSEAETLIREVLGSDGESVRAHIHLATISMRRGDAAAALDHYLKAEALDATSPGVRTSAGIALIRLRRWQEAAEKFEAALAVNADDVDAWDGLGVAYRALKQPGDAVFAHMRAVALIHTRPRSHVNLAIALGEVGHTRWAAEALKVAMNLDPTDPAPPELLAQLHERVFNEPQIAEQLRTKAKELRLARRGVTSDDSDSSPVQDDPSEVVAPAAAENAV
jgi:tetratricopeptide (TPR) repeat protein